MKNIIKYITIFAVVFAFTSCEENSNFEESDIALTQVYTLTDISGENAAFKINIYKKLSLITEYATVDKLKSYRSSDFVDSSTDTNYEVTVNKIDDDTTMNYVLSADRVTGVGTLTVDAVTVYSVTVSEKEVYN